MRELMLTAGSIETQLGFSPGTLASVLDPMFDSNATAAQMIEIIAKYLK